MSRNQVLFKGRKNGITIYLDPSSSFTQLKEMLAEKLVNAQEFFTESTTSITFDGKELSGEEESELITIISTKSDIDISFFNGTKDKKTKETIEPNKETLEEEKPQKKENDTETTNLDIEKTDILDSEFNPRENETFYHFGSLRSGQEISYDGSVMIIGDVNPGAEVIAKGNVVVMGSLRGLVHAGCLGDENTFVVALNLDPVQLRVGSIYTYIPQESKEQSGNSPSLAFVDDGKIFVRPLAE